MADAVQQLIEAMQHELQWQRDLAMVLDNKLDAMRHYDMSRLEALGQSEQKLMQGLRHNEMKRKQAVRQAASKLCPRRSENVVNASELARSSGEPARGRILALAAMLKEVAQKVQSLNRVNAMASQRIMGHFDQIFRIIAQSGRDIGLYGQAGKKMLLEQNRLVDAIA